MDAKKDIARTFYEQNKFVGALHLYIELENGFAEMFGEEHEKTLNAKKWIAKTLREQGNFEEALVIFNELHDTRIKLFGITTEVKQW